MESKRIIPTGLLRNTPGDATPDEGLAEAINVRYKDGAWRGVKAKAKDADYIGSDGISVLYYHPQSGKYICIISRDDSIYVDTYVPTSTGGGTVELLDIGLISTDAEITHVGNFVYVYSVKANNTWIFFWNDATSEYVYHERIPAIKFVAGTSDYKGVTYTADTTGLTTDQEKYNVLSGGWLQTVKDQSELGFIHGNLMVRYAFRLFDGSYIMHSEPIYVHAGINGTPLYITDWEISAGFEKLKLYINIEEDGTLIRLWSSIKMLRSICVFVTKVASGYTVPEFYDNIPSNYLPIDEEGIREINDPIDWFKIREYDISDLSGDKTESIDSFKNYTLNSTLTKDDFTHHNLIPTCTYTINNKIHAGNTITDLSIVPSNYFRQYFSISNTEIITDDTIIDALFGGSLVKWDVPSTLYEYFCDVYLLTDSGIKIKTTQITENFYDVYIGPDYQYGEVIFNTLFIYPDQRAFKVLFWMRRKSDGLAKEISYYSMESANNNTYAYIAPSFVNGYVEPLYKNFCLILPSQAEFEDTGEHALRPHTNHIYSDTFQDYNRVQVSKLTNPFVWDAANSYRFGSERNTVLAMITAQEPVTETEFGMYPVHVFTDAGIYALERGSGDVMYSNVTEVNKEVLSNVKGLYGITGAIVFVTSRGLMILEGRQVSELAAQARGDVESLITNTYFLEAISDPKTGVFYSVTDDVVTSYLSEEFLTYIQTARIAHSNTFNELILSAPGELFSYVYNLDTKSWHTITENYTQFLGTNGYKDGYFYDLNSESGYQPYLIQSRPFSLGTDGYKKINHILARTSRTVLNNYYDSIMVFGSNDAVNWVAIGKTLITDDTTSLVLRNLPGHYKFLCYAIVGSGEYFRLTSMDVSFTTRYSNKLR